MRFVACAQTLSTRPPRGSLASLRAIWSLIGTLVLGSILFLSASLLQCSFFYLGPFTCVCALSFLGQRLPEA
jgi:hypothetical protein